MLYMVIWCSVKGSVSPDFVVKTVADLRLILYDVIKMHHLGFSDK